MSSTEIYESKKTGGRLNAPACGLTFFNRNVAALLIVKNQNLDFFVFVCHWAVMPPAEDASCAMQTLPRVAFPPSLSSKREKSEPFFLVAGISARQ